MNRQNENTESVLQNQPQDDLNSETVEKNEKHKMSKRKKRWLTALAIIIGLVIVIAATYFILYFVGKGQLVNEKSGLKNPKITNAQSVDVDDDGNTVQYNGTTYKYNKNMTTMLFMGVDVDSIKKTSTNYGKNGQADAIYLMAMDTSTGKSDVICISRDAMADVDIYSKSGELIGTRRKQLCLAYAYGDKRHTSCQNTVKSVERLMFGIPVNTYFALDLSGVAPLTNAMGGVVVTTYDENGNANGTKKLTGQDARYYVQARNITKLDSNNLRMGNQKEFLRSFIASAKAKTRQNITAPLKMYNVGEEYSVSNINASKITYLATKFISNGADVQFHTVPGAVVAGEGNHAEFNVDNDALFEMILSIFYKIK